MWIFSCPPRKPLPTTAYTAEIHWRSIRGLSHVLSVNVSKVSGLRGKAIIVKFFSSSRGAASSDFFFRVQPRAIPLLPFAASYICMRTAGAALTHNTHFLSRFSLIEESLFSLLYVIPYPRKKKKRSNKRLLPTIERRVRRPRNVRDEKERKKMK